MVLSAQELHARGVAAINGGRVRAARSPLVRALERAADDAVLGAVEASLAYVEAETGNRDAALALCERALARDGLSEQTRGALLGQRGLLVLLSGHLVEAVAELGRAVGVLDDFPALQGRALLNRGNAFLQLGDLGRARLDFERAAPMLRAAELPVEAAMSDHNLGYTRFLTGDLAGALRVMDQAASVLAPLSAVSAAVGDQDRAEVLMAAGLVDEGQAALDRAACAYGKARLTRRQAEAELTLARSLLLTRPADAAVVARRAARRFARAGGGAWRTRAEAVTLQADLACDRVGPARLRLGSQLVEQLRAEGLRWEAISLGLAVARTHAARGDLVAARTLLGRSELSPRAPLAVRLAARDLRAAVAASPRGSFVHLRAGLSELHRWQSSFGSLDLQTNVVGHGVRLGVRGLSLAVEARSHAVLFEWSERARMLASRVQPVRAPQDEETLADLAELRADPPPAREAELRRRIRERAWRHQGSGLVADPIPLARLRDEVRGDTALVAYVVAHDRVVALVVTDRGTRRHELGDRASLDRLLGGLLADLDMAASNLPAPLAAAVQDALRSRLAALSDVLVAPLVRDLGERRVVLTPSGVLAGVPWPLLAGLAGRPVTVAQSATSWVARQAVPLSTATAGFVAGPRVARAEAEVLAAAKEWGDPPVLRGAGARADAVTALAGRVDVLHVAAHGRHSAENPLFSGLELADGTWYGYDIDQVASVPDVVLLSACEVGRSSVRWGEELIGMTAAWLHAGARYVLASPAAVNDEAAYDALVAVHAGLAAGLDPAVALAATAAPPGRAPARPPAPFVCFG